jgi:dolichol-phosphate mannosyltransferase
MAAISIVIPVYNEEACLKELLARLLNLRKPDGDKFEYIFVDDGSSDRSLHIIKELESCHTEVRHIALSRNFGHEAAITAGLDYASGDAVVIIDADLQDPPEVITELLAKWRQGNQIVYARRIHRKGESMSKKISSWLFYRLIRALSDVEIPADTGDFRLIDRCVVEQFRRCREQNRFVRGIIAWTGFKQIAVPYERDKRYAGSTKYSLAELIRVALDALTGFSTLPLRIGLAIGMTVCLCSVLIVAIVIAQKLILGISVPGYAMIASGIFFLGGVQLLVLGLIGTYVGKLFRQSQNRPLYIVTEKSNSLPASDKDN